MISVVMSEDVVNQQNNKYINIVRCRITRVRISVKVRIMDGLVVNDYRE